MSKFYRVKKDTFWLKEGAIIELIEKLGNNGGYQAIEDIWDNTPIMDGEYITAAIVEHDNNKEYFERVYPDTLGGKVYKTAEQLREVYKEAFNK